MDDGDDEQPPLHQVGYYCMYVYCGVLVFSVKSSKCRNEEEPLSREEEEEEGRE